jgi:hypothetical protein
MPTRSGEEGCRDEASGQSAPLGKSVFEGLDLFEPATLPLRVLTVGFEFPVDRSAGSTGRYTGKSRFMDFQLDRRGFDSAPGQH